MTTIDQQAALLRAVCQRPDDTQDRLVFADWCEDNGQEARAEFVRVQVEFENWRSICANHDSQRSKCPGCVLRRRSSILLRKRIPCASTGQKQARYELWAGEPLRSIRYAWYTYRRGFVEEVKCDRNDWFAHGPQVVQTNPVTTVKVTDLSLSHFGPMSLIADCALIIAWRPFVVAAHQRGVEWKYVVPTAALAWARQQAALDIRGETP